MNQKRYISIQQNLYTITILFLIKERSIPFLELKSKKKEKKETVGIIEYE